MVLRGQGRGISRLNYPGLVCLLACLSGKKYDSFVVPYLLRLTRHIYPRMMGSVHRLSSGTVIKISTAFSIHLDAEVTCYVRENTTIPVPAVHHVWTKKEDGG
jgi:hypothetical protein